MGAFGRGITARETILLVHQQPAKVSRLRAILAGYGYIVLAVDSEQEALELCRLKIRVHLVISEFALQGMRGVDMITALHNLGQDIRFLWWADYDARLLRVMASAHSGIPLLPPLEESDAVLETVRHTIESGRQPVH